VKHPDAAQPRLPPPVPCQQPCGGLCPRTAGTALALLRRAEYNVTMGRRAVVVLYVLAMVAVVVGVDVLFLRHLLWERLVVNVAIVLVFAAFYFRFLKRA
jgi:hypothetical protein